MPVAAVPVLPPALVVPEVPEDVVPPPPPVPPLLVPDWPVAKLNVFTAVTAEKNGVGEMRHSADPQKRQPWLEGWYQWAR